MLFLMKEPWLQLSSIANVETSLLVSAWVILIGMTHILMIFDAIFADALFRSISTKLVFTVLLSPSLPLSAVPPTFHLGTYPINPVGCFIAQILQTLLFLQALAVCSGNTGR